MDIAIDNMQSISKMDFNIFTRVPKSRIFFLLFFLVLSLSDISKVFGQSRKKFDLFYLSIGSSHYINDSLNTNTNIKSIFRNIKGANKSARMMSVFFQKKGATGVLFTSSEDSFISRILFFKGIDSVKRKIGFRKSKNPLIIYYYCGHGVAETVSGKRFLVPGDMQGDLSTMGLEEKKTNAVFLNDLYDSMYQLKLPFLFILDCCADREVEYFEDLSKIFTGTAITDLYAAGDIAKAWYGLKGDFPVVCSSQLSNASSTVTDPLDPASKLLVGPLYRKIILSSQAATIIHPNLRYFLSSLVSVKDAQSPKPTFLCEDKIDRLTYLLW